MADFSLILGLISVVLGAFSSFVAFRSYFHLKNRSTLLLAIVMFFETIALLLECIAINWGTILVVEIMLYMYILILFGVVFFIDSIVRDSTDPVKIFFATILVSFLLFELNQVDPISFTPEVHFKTPLLIALETMNLFTGILLVYFLIKIHIKAPHSSKKHTILIVVGCISMSVISSLILVINRMIGGPLGIHLIFSGFGILLILIGWIKDPTLAYILPFYAIRIDIVEMKSGIPLYSYVWNTRLNLMDTILYSGMLSGITGILRESVNRGKVREIEMENGSIIIQQGEKSKIASVLLTTQSSLILRNALTQFTNAFEELFHLGDTAQGNLLVDLYEYTSAKTLVDRFFGFVPKYD